MPRFRIMYHCSNLNVPSSIEEEEPVIGFYTTRVVVSKDEKEARKIAVNELLNEEQVKHFVQVTRTTSGKEATIEIEECKKLLWYECRRQKHIGFTLY